jgi:raffinose/stachyose/melibiose transport system permease protein
LKRKEGVWNLKNIRAKFKGQSKWLFLLPGVIIYLIVIVIPTFRSFYTSLFKWNGLMTQKTFVGLDNYINLFTKDPIFPTALLNNIIWVVLSMTLTIGVALLLALILNRAFKGRAVFRGIFYFPYVLSGVVVGICWAWMYDPSQGLLNTMLRGVGLDQFAHTWIADGKTALIATYIASMWRSVGAPMVIFLAGLQTIPSEILEASDIDGAGSFRKFFWVMVPMLKETFLIVVATQIIRALKVYDIIIVMTGGGPANSTQTLATWMVLQTFRFTNYGKGTAIACVMLIMMMIIILPYVNHMSKER